MSLVRPDRALLLTAGVATRLRPLSYDRAKAAFPVAGDPLIRRILKTLPPEGIRDVVLNLHYKPETITRLVGDGSDLGLRVRYSWEQPLLGSAGGPRHALPLLDADRFFIINGDTLTDLELAHVASAHARSGARVTMAVVRNPAPAWYGGVLVDERSWVRGFASPGDPRPSFHYIGVQVVEREVFVRLPDGRPAHTVSGIYPMLLASERRAIYAFICGASFHDIGSPADYLSTSLTIAAAEGLETLPTGRNVKMDSTARVVRTAIWDDVVIEAGAELVDCVVGDGVRVPAGSRFTRSAIVSASGRRPGPTETIIEDLLVAPLIGAKQ